jgi:hypothetical protein
LSGAAPRAAAALAVLLCAEAAHAAGRRHALLVGVGRYSHLPKATLEGPPFDVQGLQAVLSQRWGFDPGDITVLLDEKATRPAILAGIDGLAARSAPGDFIFIYFSGHGTSGYDPAFKDVGLDVGTGALVPADFKPGRPAELRNGLIIGSRDLRPRLLELDGQREVLVAFDSCFSGNAARALFAAGRARYLDPADLVVAGERGVSDPAAPSPARATGAAEAPYPYRSLVYVSAASPSERAMDIGSALIRSGRIATVDGRPHGAFTNALIEGLSGAADTNRDGAVTNGEIYGFVKDRVTERFPHQPQLLLPAEAREALLRSPVFGSERPAAPPVAATAAPAPRGPFRVKLQGVAAPLAATMGGIPGVAVAEGEGAYDLLVVQDDAGFKLFHPSGDELASYDAAQLAEVLKRVSRQAAVQGLIDLTFPEQDFNVTLEIPGNRGFLEQGEEFTIEFSAETDSHVLLVDVDGQGYVSVLYPFDAEEARPVRKGRVPATGELRVAPPFGTDHLKLLAFRDKPPGLEKWMGRGDQHFAPTGPEVAELLRMIRDAKGSKAQARLKVVTRGPRGRAPTARR